MLLDFRDVFNYDNCMEKFKKLKKTESYIFIKDKGFTLAEMIVTLVILAVLAAILVPTLLGYINKSKSAGITTEADALRKATLAGFVEVYGRDESTMPQVYKYDQNKSKYDCYSYTNSSLQNAAVAISNGDSSKTDFNRTVAEHILQYTETNSLHFIGYDQPKFDSSHRWNTNIGKYNPFADKTNTVNAVYKTLAGYHVADQFIFFAAVGKDGTIYEFDYMRSGSFYQYRNGTVSIYSSDDTSHGFPIKTDQTGNYTIVSFG